jgi:hypothetical protein
MRGTTSLRTRNFKVPIRHAHVGEIRNAYLGHIGNRTFVWPF